MSTIGYYNYYNNPHRYTPQTPHDRYQEMVERYEANKNSIHANNENPYSENNLKMREFETKLSSWAAGVRSKCTTEQDVYSYLAQKYFGKSTSTYVDRLKLDEETRAMYDNDLNAILYGTYQNSNTLDPRLNWTQQDWDTEEAQRKAFNHSTISSQMANLLANNGIKLDDDDSLLIKLNPYDFTASVGGIEDYALIKEITDALNSEKNAKELFYYVFQNTENKNADSVAKFRAYKDVFDFTGYKIPDLLLKDGEFYTYEGESILEMIKDRIGEDSSIPLEFKGAAYEAAKNLLDIVAQKGWENIPDLELSIGYSNENGFFGFGKTYEV